MKLFTFIAYFLSQLTVASEITDQSWKNTLTENAITNFDQQSYCYTNQDGVLEGRNLDLRVRLASVSKLVVSLWASEKLGLNYKYQTKLYIKNNSLHIAGSFDPFFGNEKVFYLLSQLNELGYSSFDKITFDKNLIVFPGAQAYVEVYPQITPLTVANDLTTYFNTNSWTKSLKAEYTRIASLSPKGKFKDAVQFSVKNIQFVENNPFENNSDTRVLTYTSPELHKYLKETNIRSNNYSAHTIFLQLGGEAAFASFLNEYFHLNENQIRFYSGSGLPTYINGIRKDNYGTCAVVLSLISEFQQSTENQNMAMKDVMAVPGSDGGTFRNRAFPADFKNAFVAKTGTLTNVSTLAGMMSTQHGHSFFGVFNESPNIIGAKKAQNTMVETIMRDLGGPLAFDYKFSDFYTYNKDEVIKKNVLEDSGLSDFMPFEEELK